jgi:hypothetical protein
MNGALQAAGDTGPLCADLVPLVVAENGAAD